MIKKIAVLATVALSAMAFTAVAVAQPGNSKAQDAIAGAKCVQAGVGTLVSLGLMPQAAQGKLDYSPLGTNGAGLIRLPLATPTYIPLKDVIALHRSNPELFAWCDNV
jgi:NO-binding membrane sensor protein with MHYT domain